MADLRGTVVSFAAGAYTANIRLDGCRCREKTSGVTAG